MEISYLIPKLDFSFHHFMCPIQPPIHLAGVRSSFPLGREGDHSDA
jgi:hypothetical protein